MTYCGLWGKDLLVLLTDEAMLCLPAAQWT